MSMQVYRCMRTHVHKHVCASVHAHMSVLFYVFIALHSITILCFSVCLLQWLVSSLENLKNKSLLVEVQILQI